MGWNGSWEHPGWDRTARGKELPQNWNRVIRPYVLGRDNHRCYWGIPRGTRWEDYRGKRCYTRATHVDHIHRGNDHRPENLQSLCAEHHYRKSERERNESRLGLAPKRATRGYQRFEKHPGMLD